MDWLLHILDPATIKYVVISHGHSDHSGGAKYLQDRFNAHVLLTAADWDLLDRSNGTKPRRDMVVTDGQKLTLGDTTLTFYATPGHTPGTMSTLIPERTEARPTSRRYGAAPSGAACSRRAPPSRGKCICSGWWAASSPPASRARPFPSGRCRPSERGRR